MREAHEHCWHVTSSTTNGLAIAGFDSEICCQCGQKQKRNWRMVPDPKHGPHAAILVPKYSKPKP